MYYKSSITGKILTETQVNVLNDIWGGEEVNAQVERGCLIPMEEKPSVVDLIKSRNLASAAFRYKEIHGGTIADAWTAVKTIRADVSRFKRMNKKEETK